MGSNIDAWNKGETSNIKEVDCIYPAYEAQVINIQQKLNKKQIYSSSFK